MSAQRGDDALGEGVAQMEKLLIGRRTRHDQPVLVAHDHPADDPRAADRRLHDRDVVGKLGLEDGVEVLRAAERADAVRVGQLREDAHLVRVLELRALRHRVRGVFRLPSFAAVGLAGDRHVTSNDRESRA